MNQQRCKFCRRAGLPILPVRPALMDKYVREELKDLSEHEGEKQIKPIPDVISDNAPVLPNQIKMEIEAQGETAYTLRTLREGFLYIYSEAYQRWEYYHATEDGYYYPLGDPQKHTNSAIYLGADGKLKQPCATSPEDRARASLVTLPIHYEKAYYGAFWFGWSQVQWTQKTLNQLVENKEKCLHQFDADTWMQSQTNERAFKLNQVNDLVAEYHPNANNALLVVKKGDVPLSYHDDEQRPKDSDTLIQQAQSISSFPAAIMVLSDPTGIAEDINYLVNKRIMSFRSNPSYQRELDSIAGIESIQYVVRQLEKSTIENIHDPIKKTLFDTAMFSSYGQVFIDFNFDKKYRMIEEADEDRLRTLDDRVEKEFQEKWNSDYVPYYHKDKVNHFIEKYNQAEYSLNEKIVAPMVTLFLDWFESLSIKHYFYYFFDDADIKNGAYYLAIMTSMLEGMLDKRDVNEFTAKRLTGSASETDKEGIYNNLIMRATVFNYQPYAQNVTQFINTQTSASHIIANSAFDRGIDGFNAVIGNEINVGPLTRGLENSYTELQLLHENFQRVVMQSTFNIIDNLIDSKLSESLLAFADVTGKRIKIITLTGNHGDFIEAVLETSIKKIDKSVKINPDRLRHYITQTMQKMQLEGVTLNKPHTVTAAVIDSLSLQEAFAPYVKQNLSKSQERVVAEKLANALDFVETPIEANKNAIRRYLFSSYDKTPMQGIKASPSVPKLPLNKINFAGSSLSSMLQIHALIYTGLPKESAKEILTSPQSFRQWGTYLTNAGMAVGATAEALETGLKMMFKNINSQGYLLNTLKISANISGILNYPYALFQFLNAWDEYQKDNVDISMAYMASGLAGVHLGSFAFNTLFLPTSRILLGLIYHPVGLFIAGIVIITSSIYIMKHSKVERDLQNWLVKSMWGVPEKRRLWFSDDLTSFACSQHEKQALQVIFESIENTQEEDVKSD